MFWYRFSVSTSWYKTSLNDLIVTIPVMEESG